MNLSNLDSLKILRTELCAPRDTAFQSWLGTIEFTGLNCPSAAPSEIDVAVFYTPAARRVVGDVAAVEAQIDLMVATTNFAYATDGVNQRLRLVAAEEVAYAEAAPGTDFKRLKDPSDGHMDSVHTVRDDVAADVVILLLSRGTGLADPMVTISPDFEAHAFGVVNVDSVRWFAHELGHLMGLSHERFEECPAGACFEAVFDYARGYVNQRAFDDGAPVSARWHTIMAYPQQCLVAGFTGEAGCVPLLRFSNPNRVHPDPGGRPPGRTQNPCLNGGGRAGRCGSRPQLDAGDRGELPAQPERGAIVHVAGRHGRGRESDGGGHGRGDRR